MYELVNRLSGAATKDPEVGSVLLKSSIGEIVPITWSEKISECRNGKIRENNLISGTLSEDLSAHLECPRR
jgi:hypothetical protein